MVEKRHCNMRRAEDQKAYHRSTFHGRYLVAEIVASITLVFAAIAIYLSIVGYNKTLSQVQQGRHAGSALTCAVVSSIAQAGKSVITGSLIANANLHQTAAMRRRANQYGEAYITAISHDLDHKVGHKGDHLINHDGTVNCTLFAEIAKAK